MDSTPLVCITGQVRSHLIGTDAFQECDIVGVTTPIVKHSWLVQDVEEIPHVIKAAFHIARTGRCGPVLVDIPRDIQEAEIDFSYPDEVDLPGWRPPTRGHPRQIAEAARQIAAAERPVLYVGGGTLNADACAELLELAEVGRLPGDHDADGEGRVPGDARAPLRLARHARAEVVEPGDEHVRPARRRRRPLRRPRHRQARRVRARRDASSTSTSTPPRSRSCAARTCRSSGRSSRCSPTSPRSCDARGRAPDTEPWLRQIEAWREEFPLRYGNGGDAQAAARARDAAAS